jgi:hypothetical protein
MSTNSLLIEGPPSRGLRHSDRLSVTEIGVRVGFSDTSATGLLAK